MQPERRIAWRNVEIGARVTGNGEVAAGVDTVLGLHGGLEAVDVLGGGDERGDFGGGAVALGEVVGEIAFYAAGVVAVAVAARVPWSGGVTHKGHGSVDG